MPFRCPGGLKTPWSLLFGLLATVLPMRGQVENEPLTNLQVFQRLAFEIGSELTVRMSSGKVQGATVFPREIGLPVEQDLIRGLRLSGASISPGDSGGRRVEFAITDARVVLENTRRDGFLGSKLVDRVIVLAGRAKTWGEGNTIEYYDVTRSLRDTVQLSGIDRLSSQTLAFTRMTLPRQGFFDDLLEPLVVLGSVGVAVYLLFAVRS